MARVLVQRERPESLREAQAAVTVHLLDLDFLDTLALLQILGACLRSDDLASGPRARILELFAYLLNTLPPRFRERLLVAGYLR